MTVLLWSSAGAQEVEGAPRPCLLAFGPGGQVGVHRAAPVSSRGRVLSGMQLRQVSVLVRKVRCQIQKYSNSYKAEVLTLTCTPLCFQRDLVTRSQAAGAPPGAETDQRRDIPDGQSSTQCVCSFGGLFPLLSPGSPPLQQNLHISRCVLARKL